ncbi:GspE/PulE family protein, partial [Collimonas silvisoli]|uniref:GspE/PulE family protein n=1 Tax=Collimonas silvisoli TaxID=2825884 RepID=UPI001B8AB948
MAAVFPNANSTSPISGLARALLQAGRLSVPQIEALHKKASDSQTPFIASLLESGHLDARSLALFCAETFGYPQLDLSVLNLSMLPEKAIDAKLMESHTVLALAKRGNKIYVALSDPTNIQALDQIKFQTELTVEPIIVEHPTLLKQIQKLVKSAEQSLSEMVGDEQEINFVEEDSAAVADAAATDIDDAPVVRFLQKILTDAINQGASDLHFEPFEKFYRIRFRVDGVLRDMAQPPLSIKEKLASRIKVISKLDISEKRVPQDGRMRL